MCHDIYGGSEELKNPDGTYPCFGDADVDALLLATWAPGAPPVRAPEGAGMPISETSRFVVQMHYHPTGEGPEVDLSALQLKWTNEEPSYEAAQAFVGNNGRQYDNGTGLQPGMNDSGDEAEFLIPAGARGHVETMLYRQEVPITFPIYSVGTHMHYAGIDMKIELIKDDPEPGEPETECLIQTPAWDFNWQGVYDFDAPIGELPTIGYNDEMLLRCTYDNSLENDAVRQALAEQGVDEPHDICLGDETLDEMCLGIFGIMAPVGLMDELY